MPQTTARAHSVSWLGSRKFSYNFFLFSCFCLFPAHIYGTFAHMLRCSSTRTLSATTEISHSPNRKIGFFPCMLDVLRVCKHEVEYNFNLRHAYKAPTGFTAFCLYTIRHDINHLVIKLYCVALLDLHKKFAPHDVNSASECVYYIVAWIFVSSEKLLIEF